jgi:hypothetical protein
MMVILQTMMDAIVLVRLKQDINEQQVAGMLQIFAQRSVVMESGLIVIPLIETTVIQQSITDEDGTALLSQDGVAPVVVLLQLIYDQLSLFEAMVKEKELKNVTIVILLQEMDETTHE